jgi:hypothetical protein
MEETTHLNLPYILPSQAQKHVTHNEALRALDALVHLSVIDRHLASPPAAPADGDRYIVAAPGSGAWTGKEGWIAAWQDGIWSFFSPRAGWLAWILDETALVYWTGSAWIEVASAMAAFHNLSLLGVGTTADGENPFAAKLNKALWTARRNDDGGNGDLRYTLNKQSTLHTLSMLLQSNWSGRAEIGLTGDDDLHIKVSPDGSNFLDALVIDKTSGLMTHADGIVPRTLFVANSGSTNDSLSGSGSYQDHTPGFTLPAGFITAGRALRVTAHWRLTTGSVAVALRFRLLIGGTTLVEIAPGNVVVSQENRSFSHCFNLQGIAAPGASSPVLASIQGNVNGGQSSINSAIAQPVNLPTSDALEIVLATQWDAAGTGIYEITLAQLIVEALN